MSITDHLPKRGWLAVPAALAGFFLFTASIATAATVPSATTGPTTAISSTTATVSGTVDPNGTATSWYFQYGISTDTAYGSQTAAKSAGAGSASVNVSGHLGGLAPATSYHFRLVATSSAGTTYGGQGVFNTTAAPAVVTGAASHLTASAADLNGIVNPEGLATNWYFEYGTTTAYGSKTAVQGLAASPNNTNVAIALSNLTPQSTYDYRIVARSSAGSSVGSNLSLKTGLSVTLNSSASSVVYGGYVVLSGALTNNASGKPVVVQSEAFNQSTFASIASLTTGTDGEWTYSARPTARTTYQAVANGGTSSPAVVGVRPAVYITPLSAGRLSTKVVSTVSFGSHVLQLQRLSGNLWVTWKYVRLNLSGTTVFSTSLPNRTMVRMAIGPFVPGIDQAAPGYLAGFSRAIRYNRS